MARPKATPPPTIEETIGKKIESIKSEIQALQEQLDHWEKISEDYQVNRSTIESILSVHQAPDIAAQQGKSSKKASK